MISAFVDESHRGRGSYLLAATMVTATDAGSLRRTLRGLCERRQYRIHCVKESDRRRRTIISALARSTARVVIYQATGPEEHSRAACLTELVTQLAQSGTRHLTVESRAHRDAADRRVIHAALEKTGYRLEYRHVQPRSEPLLWISDVAAWAYGAGGDWRRRISPVIENVVTLP